jgi:hypothetical protein
MRKRITKIDLDWLEFDNFVAEVFEFLRKTLKL